MSLNSLKSVQGMMWVPISTMSEEINNAKGVGADTYLSGVKQEDVTAIKNGGIDYYANGIAQAHSLGMKFRIIMITFYWTPDRSKTTFINTPAYQEQFKKDVEWFLSRYPNLDGIELEELTLGYTPADGGEALRKFYCCNTTNTGYLFDLNNLVKRYHSLNSDFYWGWNSQSNTISGNWNYGIDLACIRDNNLFNSFCAQNTGQTSQGPTVGAYINTIRFWEGQLPHCRIYSHTYVTSSALLNSDKCLANKWAVPACWNQAFFDQLRWAKDNNHPVNIFVLMRLKTSSAMWPNDLTPGATAGHKINHIWSTSITPPPSPSKNLIQNPGFESGTTSWLFHTNGTGTFSTVSPGYEGSNTAQLAFSSGGSNIQLYQEGITLEPDTRYQLSFTAYSTTGHDVTVRLLKHVSPYTAYAADFTANLGTNWQTFTTEFTTSGFTDTVNDGRLQFWLAPFAASGDNYYIDDVRLEVVNNQEPIIPTVTNLALTKLLNEIKTFFTKWETEMSILLEENPEL